MTTHEPNALKEPTMQNQTINPAITTPTVAASRPDVYARVTATIIASLSKAPAHG